MQVLVTGFDPYGGRDLNPATEVMKALDATKVGKATVAGRRLPVSFRRLKDQVRAVLEEVRPDVVISLGLWPGEPMIRLERVAVNVADFEIPDNDGACVADQAVLTDNVSSRPTTLPIRAIEQALLAEGIPARISSTAGTFLCNATMFNFLSAIEATGGAARCGFVHVPYLPVQVAWMLDELKRERKLELHQRADLCSMELETMVRAVRKAIEVTVEAPAPG